MVLTDSEEKIVHKKGCTFLFSLGERTSYGFLLLLLYVIFRTFLSLWRFNAKLHSSCRRQFSVCSTLEVYMRWRQILDRSIYPLSNRISFFLCIREVRCFFPAVAFLVLIWGGVVFFTTLYGVTVLWHRDTRWQRTSLDAIARTKTLKVTNKSVKRAQTSSGNIWPTIRCFSICAIADTKTSQIDHLIVYLYHFHSSRRQRNKFLNQ